MKFGVCDIRRHDEKTPQYYANVFFINNTYEEVIIIGHSNNGLEIYGLSVEDIDPNGDIYLMWIYSCYSANAFCPQLSKKGYMTIGYDNKILTFINRNPLELEYIENNLKSLKDIKEDNIELTLKSKMYDCAKEEIKKGEFLLGAIVNYNRLCLKTFMSASM